MPSKDVTEALNDVREMVERSSVNPEKNIFPHFCRIYICGLFQAAKEEKDWERFCKAFEKLKTHEARVKHFLEDQIVTEVVLCMVADFVTQNREKIGKCNTLAKEFVLKGKNAFLKKEYHEALQSFSQAVCHANSKKSKNDEESQYALGFANRSGVLHHLKRYEECLVDIQEALNNGYPSDRRHLLITRKILCLKALGRTEEVDTLMSSLEVAGDAVQNGENEKAIGLLKLMDSQMNEVNEGNKCRKKHLEMNISHPHEKLPNACNAIDVKCSKTRGRYVVATQDIKPSEVVFAETPYCQWLKPSLYNDFCFHCMTHLNDYHWPCRRCSVARFCSKSCADYAWSKYHHYECSAIDIFKHLGSAHLAFKAVCIAGFEDAVAAKPSDSVQAFLNSKTDYEKILSLVDHADQLPYLALFSFTTAAMFVTILAEKLPSVKLPQHLRASFGGLILKHMLQFRTNGISIMYDDMENIYGRKKLMLDYSNLRRIGCGIYSSVSLLNHSCGQTLYSLYDGSKLVLKAVDGIKAGDEITFNYGFRYKVDSTKERQDSLKSGFFFTCKCKYCAKMPEYLGNARKCIKCSGPMIEIGDDSKCTKCGYVDSDYHTDIMEINAIANTGAQLLNQGMLKESKKFMMKSLQLARGTLWRHHHKIAEICQNLARCCDILEDHKAALENWSAALEVILELHGDQNYDAVACMLNMAMANLHMKKQTKDSKKIKEHLTKAKEFFNRAQEIRNNLVDKEYYYLIATDDSLKDLELMAAVAKELKIDIETNGNLC